MPIDPEPTSWIDDEDLDILIFIARVGRVLARHVQALFFPDLTLDAVRKRLRRHLRSGLLAGAAYSENPPRALRGKQPPRHLGKVYLLTPAGIAQIRKHFPTLQLAYEKVIVRDEAITHQAQHQVEYADLIVQVLRVLPTVPGAIGINSSAEMELGAARVPRCDGFLVVRRWMDSARLRPRDGEESIHWLVDEKLPGQVDRTFAIEIDRKTEARSVIMEKARSYLAVYQSGWWQGRYQFPLPVFVVPDAYRQEAVLTEWQAGWPSCPIMITTKPELDAHGLDAPIWIEKVRDQRRLRTFFDRWLEPTLEES
ncbi:MAG TPA: replication-relaxation family protein [Herpetosiphonaceae bacterium]